MTERKANRLRAIADYCLYSDLGGREWATLTLRQALREGKITGYEVLGSWGGIFGLQHVAFTVDVTCDNQWADLTHEQAVDEFQNLLNGSIIPDSGVFVRWVTPVFDTAEIPHASAA